MSKKYVDFDNPAHLNAIIEELRETISGLEGQLAAALAEQDGLKEDINAQGRVYKFVAQELEKARSERDEARRLLAAAEEGINRNCAEIAELKKSACPHGACDSLKGEIANLRAATKGQTFYHSDEAVNNEMGILRSEVEGLKYYRDTLLRDMLDTAWQQGAEAFREAVEPILKKRQDTAAWLLTNALSAVEAAKTRSELRLLSELLSAIRSLPVPERKEG